MSVPTNFFITRTHTIIRDLTTIFTSLLAFITSCNDIQKPKSVKNLIGHPLTGSVYFYLLKYNNGLPASARSEDFPTSLATISKSITDLNAQTLDNNRYSFWRQKINKMDSTKRTIERLNGLNYELRYYFWLNYKSDLHVSPPTKVRDKVLKDAFFIKNGFDFYSDLWYLHPYLTIEQNSYDQLIEKSDLFNLVLTGESSGMTDFTAEWIKKVGDDGLPLPFFRTINPYLAKKLKNELESKFLIGDDKNNGSFQLLDDFLTKEVKRQAIILIEYIE